MPLNIGGGDAKPYVSFKINDLAWFKSSREGGNEKFDFDQPALFDVQNLVMGWLKIDKLGRDWQPWPDVKTRPEAPSGEHRIGFQIDVTSNKMFGDEPTRQYSENTFGNLQFIAALYDACEVADEFKEGKNPLVKITGAEQEKYGIGKTAIPQFEITGWKGVGEAPASKAKPEPKPEPAPAADDDEF